MDPVFLIHDWRKWWKICWRAVLNVESLRIPRAYRFEAIETCINFLNCATRHLQVSGLFPPPFWKEINPRIVDDGGATSRSWNAFKVTKVLIEWEREGVGRAVSSKFRSGKIKNRNGFVGWSSFISFLPSSLSVIAHFLFPWFFKLDAWQDFFVVHHFRHAQTIRCYR